MVQDTFCRIRLDQYGLALGLVSSIMSLSYIGGYIYAVENLGYISGELESKKTTSDDSLLIKKKIVIICILGMVINASLFMASIVLIIGSYKVNHKMAIPWIVLNIIGFIFFLSILGCLGSTAKDKLKDFKSVGAFLGYSMTLAFMICGSIMGVFLYRYLGYQRAFT